MVKTFKETDMNKVMRILGIAIITMIFSMKSYSDVSNFIYSSACDGSAVKFTSTSTVSGGTIVSYEWDFNADGNFTDATGPVVTKLFASAGNYPVGLRIKSSLNVLTTSYKTITVNPLAVANFTATDACLGGTNNFTSTSTIVGGNIVKYKWDLNNDGIYDDSTANTSSRKYSLPGSYIVGLMVVTDSGCISVASKNFRVNPLPVIDFNFDKTCLYDTTEFAVSSSVSGGSIVKYYWNFNGDGIYEQNTTVPVNKLSFITAGNYIVQIKAETDNGCTEDTSKLVVIAPKPTLNFTFASSCMGYDINIDNSFSFAKSYLWKFGDGTTSTSANPLHSYAEAGVFKIELSGSSAYGCSDMISKNITIHPTPTAAFTNNNVCIGGIVNFTNQSTGNGAPIKDYYWDFGDFHGEIILNPIHQYMNAGSYTASLIVSNIFNCMDTITKTVDVYSLPVVDIVEGGPTSFCRGDSVKLSVATGGNTVLWATGENTSEIFAKNSGKYRVVLIDNHGCVNKDSVIVTVYELPLISVSPKDTQVSLGKEVSISAWGANSYTWTPADFLDNPNKADPVSLPLNTTTYTVLGEDIHGCKNSQSLKITVNTDYNLELTNLLTPNGDGANDVWNIGARFYDDNEVVIYDRWGVEVYRQKAYLDDWDGIYKGNPVPEGTYYYVITFEGTDKTFAGYLTILR